MPRLQAAIAAELRRPATTCLFTLGRRWSWRQLHLHRRLWLLSSLQHAICARTLSAAAAAATTHAPQQNLGGGFGMAHQPGDPRARGQEGEQSRMSQLLFLVGTLLVLALLIWG